MKRLISIILSVCILVSALVMSADAKPSVQASADVDPVVFLLGFSTADLYYDDGVSEEKERVWNLTANGIMELVTANLPQALWGLFKAVFFHRYDTLNEAAAKIARPVLDKMERLTMLPDGSSKYDVSVYPGKGDVPLSYRKTSRNVYLTDTYRALMNQYGRVYVFVADWRFGQVELARQLDAFIQQVKADSGKNQVTLFGFSQGGQTIGTYLYYYGDRGDVKKAVMETPAIGGTSFTASMLDASMFDLQVATMIQFGEAYMETEYHFEWLGKLVTLAPLKKSILSIVYTHVLPIARYWGGLWDLVPAKDYDRLKAQYLTDPACAPLIQASDAYHYDVLPNLGDKLRALQAQGIPLSIVCNTGSPLLFSGAFESDGILDAANVSGAHTAPFGKRLNSSSADSVCTDPTHRHLSPSMSIDASACYLPENTWFVDGQYHGQCDWDKYTYDLLCKLIMEDTLTDIYSDPAYPQFMYAQSPADRLNISFKDTGSYVSASDLTITNLSEKHSIRLVGVSVQGTALHVKVPRDTVLTPGDSVTVSVSGSMPKSAKYTPVTVTFVNTDKPLLLQQKTFKTSCQ